MVSGDTFGSGGRLQTCIHVGSRSTQFLLDCGTSSLIAMKRYGVEPNRINAILITHLHGDHFGGLPFFILDAQLISKRTFTINFIELLEGECTEIDPLKITPHRVIHESGAPPYARRVACDDKIIAYSGDTKWTDHLIEIARGADLFICEAYFFDKKMKYHLDYQTLLDRKDSLACKRMILTHMSAELLGRLDDVELELAEDGKVIAL